MGVEHALEKMTIRAENYLCGGAFQPYLVSVVMAAA